jgi:ubiquinone biosynthesis accessory factor UbiK
VPACVFDLNQGVSPPLCRTRTKNCTIVVQLQTVTHHARAAAVMAEKSPCAKLPPTRRNAMLDPKTLEDIGNKMSTLLANSPAKDIEKNAKAVMSGLFSKLDLVTREEFDIQAQVLARTRQKLKELEARVEALEKARAGQ